MTSPASPLFTTHHSPVGAWASLTFGKPGRGVRIEHESDAQQPNADLLVALHRDGVTNALPFIEPSTNSPWRQVDPASITRTLTPCIDEFAADGISLRIFTPHAALPNPKRSGSLQYSTVPGVLIEVTIDNSNSDSPATGFVGLAYRGVGGMRPVDWSSKTLTGVGSGGRWILAAPLVKDETFTIQSSKLAEQLAAGTPAIEPLAQHGGIAIKVAPRTKRSVNLVFAFYHAGAATQGIEGRYLYNAYFPRAEVVANFILQNQQKIRESCSGLDTRAKAACPDPQKLALFSQAVRAYDANTQVIETPGPEVAPYFTVIEGAENYRNVLSLTVDHLAWELYRNPWVIRNIFDLATTSYSTQDKVRFPKDPTPTELRDGGMSFVHDFGLRSSYSSPGTSAWETPGKSMATEELLNGVYLLTSYALLADDTPWAKTRLPFARELLVSMENRDHWDPEQRNGILKAETDRTGLTGNESTTLGFLPGDLGTVPGNLYIAVKTFCANMLLTTYFQNNNDLHSADYSYAFAQKTAASLTKAFDTATGLIPANLLSPDTSIKFIAALEPLAIPTYLGLTSTLAEYFPELFNALKSHATSCLHNAPQGCIDPSGALRLAGNSPLVSAAKVINILYVLERLFQIDIQSQFPSLWRETLRWSTEASADSALSDHIDISKPASFGCHNSPRLVSSALFIKPA